MANGGRGVVAGFVVGAAAAHAAEGFQVRYNLAGTLAAELFAPVDQQGWVGSIVRSDARTDKITGPDGGPLTRVLPAGSVTLANPAPPPASVTVNYAANRVRVESTGSLTQYNVLLAYVTPQRFGEGRLAFALNVPYVAKKTQSSRVTGATPAYAPAVGAFPTVYQRSLASMGAAESGQVEGLGDVEVHAGWLRRTGSLRVLFGASLVMPTGAYDPASGPDVSLGNFHTLRPAAQVAWLPRPDVSLGARITYGISSRNRDSQVRSGNWASLEGAAGWASPVGVVGVHGVMVRQVQDDSGGTWGGNRYRAEHVGAFFSTRIHPVAATFSVHYMATVSSRNARHGRYLQLRMTRTL